MQGLEKNPKLISVGPMFIPDYRVPTNIPTQNFKQMLGFFLTEKEFEEFLPIQKPK